MDADRWRECGAILPVSLIFLLLLTMIGVTAMSTTTLQERMAGNLRDREIAFQASETMLRVGEEWIAGLTAEPSPSDLGARLKYTNEDEFGELGPLSEVSRPPEVVITEVDYRPDSLVEKGYGEKTAKYYYRVSVDGWGGSESAFVELASTFARRY